MLFSMLVCPSKPAGVIGKGFIHLHLLDQPFSLFFSDRLTKSAADGGLIRAVDGERAEGPGTGVMRTPRRPLILFLYSLRCR
jgi:hypothetical protein